MPLMLSKTYEALREAGASEAAAREAAEEVANLHSRLTRIEVMVALVAAAQIPILVKLFTL